MSSLADFSIRSLVDFYTGTAIPNAPKHTGRLPLSEKEENTTMPPFALFAAEPYSIPERVAENINYRHEETPLNRVFFSEANMDVIQNRVIELVEQLGNVRISRQSDIDIKLIMRSYYLQYARNDPTEVSNELAELNDRVVNFAANRIMVEVKAYKFYRKDIMDFPEPIARSIDTKVYGTRTGELKSFF